MGDHRRALSLIVAAAVTAVCSAAQPERARIIPAPAVDEAAGQATSETVVLAGGCFWGVQAVFQHVKGVTRAVSGSATFNPCTWDDATPPTAAPAAPSPSDRGQKPAKVFGVARDSDR